MYPAHGIKQTLNLFLTDTCSILNPSGGTDEYGHATDTLTMVSDTVPCRVISDKGTTPMASTATGQAGILTRLKIVLPHGTDVDVSHIIRVDNVDYKVIDIVDERTNQPDVQVLVSKVRYE